MCAAVYNQVYGWSAPACNTFTLIIPTSGQYDAIQTSPNAPPTTISFSSGSNNTVSLSNLLTSQVSGTTQPLPPLVIESPSSGTRPAVDVSVYAGTTISAAAGSSWNGVLDAPTAEPVSGVNVPSESGETTTVTSVIEIGAGSTPLTLSQPVLLFFPGQAGELPGYYQNGTFTAIPKIAPNAVASLSAGQAGYYDQGSDLYVWTTHCTQYVLYTESTNGVTLNKSSDALLVGAADQLTATITPANAADTNVTWSSSNDSVAAVDQAGKVTAVASGEATITVTTADGGYTATCIVTVWSPGGTTDTLDDTAQDPLDGMVTVSLPSSTAIGSNSLTIDLGGGVSLSIPAGASLPSSITVQPGTPPADAPNTLVLQFSANGGSFDFGAATPATITLPVPAGMTTPQVYYLEPDGIWEQLGGTVNSGAITFTTPYLYAYGVGSGAASMPTADPGAGTYAGSRKIDLSSSGADEILYYTAATAPASFDYSMSYQTIDSDSGKVIVSSSEALVAVGVDPNGLASAPLIASYTITAAPVAPAAPVIDPDGGTYASSHNVSIRLGDGDSVSDCVYYTTDDSTPTTGSTLYAGTFTVNATETVEAIVYDPATGLSSSAAKAAFTITNPASAPDITSSDSTTCTYGTGGSFTVTTTGYPAPAITETDSLPGGVTFTDNGNGTATLNVAATTAAGTYDLSITASNGVSPDATQSFTLTVNQAAITVTANSANMTYGGTVPTFSASVTSGSLASRTPWPRSAWPSPPTRPASPGQAATDHPCPEQCRQLRRHLRGRHPDVNQAPSPSPPTSFNMTYGGTVANFSARSPPVPWQPRHPGLARPGLHHRPGQHQRGGHLRDIPALSNASNYDVTYWTAP